MKYCQSKIATGWPTPKVANWARNVIISRSRYPCSAISLCELCTETKVTTDNTHHHCIPDHQFAWNDSPENVGMSVVNFNIAKAPVFKPIMLTGEGKVLQ